MTLEEQLKIFTKIVGEPTVCDYVCDYGSRGEIWEYEEPFHSNFKILNHIEGRTNNSEKYVFYDFFVEIRNKGRVVRLHNQGEVDKWVLENKNNQTIQPEAVQIAFNLFYGKFYYLISTLIEKKCSEEQEKLNKLILHYCPSEFTNMCDAQTYEVGDIKQLEFVYGQENGRGSLYLNIDYTFDLSSGRVEKHFDIYETTTFHNELTIKDYRYLAEDLVEVQDIFNDDIEIRCDKH